MFIEKQEKEQKWEKNRWNEYKTFTKVADSPSVSIMTLNENYLNIPIICLTFPLLLKKIICGL